MDRDRLGDSHEYIDDTFVNRYRDQDGHAVIHGNRNANSYKNRGVLDGDIYGDAHIHACEHIHIDAHCNRDRYAPAVRVADKYSADGHFYRDHDIYVNSTVQYFYQYSSSAGRDVYSLRYINNDADRDNA